MKNSNLLTKMGHYKGRWHILSFLASMKEKPGNFNAEKIENLTYINKIVNILLIFVAIE
jgi:hypothetical protein